MGCVPVPMGGVSVAMSVAMSVANLPASLGLPPDADGNGNYAFFDAANYALIQMTGGVTAILVVQINRSHTNDWGAKPGIMPKIMLASGGRPKWLLVCTKL